MFARVLILLVLLPAALRAQDDLQPLFDAFAKERAAVKGDTALADKLAAKADEARKGDHLAAAGRLIRDARWALPAKPYGLPDGVRILGYNHLRHDARVNAVRYSRDGTFLLTCSDDRTVRIWDVATGREVMVYRGHITADSPDDGKSGVRDFPLKVRDAIFLPDGQRAASIGQKQLHIWDLKTGQTLTVLTAKPVKTAKGDNPSKLPLPKSLAVSDDGKRIAAGGDDGVLRVWNLDSGDEVFVSNPHANRIESIAWQPKGKFIAVVDLDGQLSLYDPSGESKSPAAKAPVADSGNAVYAVRFTADGTKLIVGGADKAPRILSAPGPDGSLPPNLASTAQKLPPHAGAIHAVAVLPDGQYFVSGGSDHEVRVTDALGEIVRSFDYKSEVTSLDVRPDGRQIAAGYDNGSLRLWDFTPFDEHRSAGEASAPLWASAVSPDGKLIAAAGADKTIRVYNPAGKLLHALEGSTAAVTSLVFLGNEKLLSGGGDKLLRLWDAQAGKALGDWPGHTGAVLALAATPDGRVALSGSADKIVKGWNTETGKEIWTWTARSTIAALAISKDAKTALVGMADGGLCVLAVADDKATMTGFVQAHVSGVAAPAFAPDGAHFASTGGDGVARIWTIPSSGPPEAALKIIAATTPGAVALSALGFSPDGKELALGGADRQVRVYETKAGTRLRILRGCNDWVTSLAYLPDGDRIVAVSADKTTRIFDVARIETLPPAGHTSAARAVAISPDGRQFASVGQDNMIRLWDRASGSEFTAWVCNAEAKTMVKSSLLTVAYAGPYLVTGGETSSLTIWNPGEKKEIRAVKLGKIYGLTPGPDGRLGVWSRNGSSDSYSIFALPDLDKPLNVLHEPEHKVSAANFSNDLNTVITGDADGRLYTWSYTSRMGWPNVWKSGTAAIGDLAFSPDRKRLILVEQSSGVVRIIDAKSHEVLATADPRGPDKAPYVLQNSKDSSASLYVAPVGERFALLADRPELVVFDYAGQEVKKYLLPSTPNSAAWTPDGKTIVTANADGSLYAIDLP